VTRPRPVLVVDNDARGRRRRHEITAVCVVTLEGVGRITSLLGSEAAGCATIEFAARLEQMLRDNDQRIQINEGKYCLLLRGLKDRNHTLLAGMKLERLFEEPFEYNQSAITLQVRAGIAYGSSAEADAESLFRVAETARELARARSRVFEVADALVMEDVQRQWKLNDELDEAVFQHQVKLYYQPKVAADDHRLVGAEGLVRWEHPTGTLMPVQFLPHLHADKMISLTRHLIRQCVRDLAGDATLPPLSVNVDPDLIERCDLTALILEELSMWSVDPSRLVVEVTEHGVMEHLDLMLVEFATLRDRGVKVAMDDFGTGHSSLAQFRHLPVDELKIDRSFVFNVDADDASRYLIDLMVGLGHYFGKRVVAEGVESLAVARVLKDAGCDVLQGFCFSPPLPRPEFSRWVDSHAARHTPAPDLA
jgi:diguanylate cyclase